MAKFILVLAGTVVLLRWWFHRKPKKSVLRPVNVVSIKHQKSGGSK